jgi:hypothetical protein
MELPTWVPDFANSDYLCNFLHLTGGRELLYFASGEMVATVSWETDPAILALSGIQLDTILKSHWDVEGFKTWNDIGVMIRALTHDFFSSPQYHTGEPILSVLARTTTGDASFESDFQRQSVEDTQSLCQDLRSVLSWKGRLQSRLQSLTPSAIHSIALNSLQRRERKQPYKFAPLSRFYKYKLSLTSKGFISMVPDLSEDGDNLCVLYGSKFPHVLRKVPGKEDTYKLVGIAYIHGFMDGEAIKWRDQGKLKEQKFILV